MVERDLDHVGRIMAQWAEQRPDLDVSPQGIVGRLSRLAQHLDEELTVVYRSFGLGEGEFDVLATLRRSGTPFELTPGGLAASTMVSSGAVTKRVDRCLEKGWVTRRVSDLDGRGRVVALTLAGRELIDEAFEAHMANEQRLVGSLGDLERARLARLLETWGRTLGA
ncbi:MarR family transcriptional regulator [Nocardioides psychrotolerans]|uniref:DNA-binding transcriptional regulator, MarR family n=1 Tax=Nocardioides psychrotolerans TaxID=1005945 RepID=A0A1I3PP60_9ACTN|nr:MarR family transcriptional regulator [Nocardioides psychrotolerans]GEP39726.1 MarR family transcriptional regulator [Nocardioides psychrotolerans]SFJ23209.1 DNA-binding transcriptional regulator, MarR family [Nocardioides psychrotolerans]